VSEEKVMKRKRPEVRMADLVRRMEDVLRASRARQARELIRRTMAGVTVRSGYLAAVD
jgi:hypothetical protein